MRSRLARRLVFAAVGVGALVAAWGLLEPRLILDECEEEGGIPGLSPDWDGKRVALLADLQIGAPLANTRMVRRAVRRVVAARPSAVVLAGDFIYESARSPDRVIRQAVDLLRPFTEAGLPVYAVLGNHDYAEESSLQQRARRAIAGSLTEALESAGIRVLRNEVVHLPSPDGGATSRSSSLWLVGLDDERAGVPRPHDVFSALPAGAPRLVLAHNPRSVETMPAAAAPLVLAGHTHGGQVRFPLKPRWTAARLFKRWPSYVDGWVTGIGSEGNHVYVNRGIGFSLLPLRIGCPPEITYFTLRSA